MKRTYADGKWSKAIRERDGYRCLRCGAQHTPSSQGLHGAHIFSRGIKRLRHDLRNGLSLCYGCHRYIDSHADAKESLARSVLGDEEYEALRLEAHAPQKAVKR